MLLYNLLFFLTVFFFFSISDMRDEGQQQQMNKAFLLGSMIVLALFVGCSDMLGGYDRYIYCDLFDGAANDISKKLPLATAYVFQEYPKEQGYGWYNILVGLITTNRYIFVLITTIIVYVFLFQSIKEYCENYPFAVMLFLALWFFFTFTYLRQVMGATIAWLGIRYIIKRSLWRFFIVWFIAFKFHNSALVLLPMYFVPVRKFTDKHVLYVMIALFILGMTGIPTALFSAYGEVDAERAGVAGNVTGFRLAYVVEAVFFLYLILSRYDEIPETPKHIVMLNMSLVFCGVLLFFVKNENGGRLSWYYMIGVISTVSYLSTYTKKNIQQAFLMIVVSIFLFNRILTAWGVQLSPYKTFFSNGIRPGDTIEQKYEYDHSYDYDKFYRPAFRFMER